MPEGDSLSRRKMLELLGASGLSGLAGCNSTPGTATTTPSVTPTPTATPTESTSSTATDSANPDISWTQLPGPAGGPVHDISVSAADTEWLYATTKTAGVYASRTGGNSWIQGYSGMHHRPRIWASPHDPSTAYTSLERTDDGGLRWYGKVSGDDPTGDRSFPWIRSLKSARVYRIAWSPFDAGTLYAGTPDGLYRTFDDGRTWDMNAIAGVELPPGHAGWDFSVHPQRDGVITAGLGNRVATSTDHGETWSVTDLGEEDTRTTNHFIRGVEFVDGSSSAVYLAVQGVGVFRLENGGLTELTSALPPLVYPKVDLPLSLSASREKLYFIAGRSRKMYPMREWWDDRTLYEYDTTTDGLRTVHTPVKPNAVTMHPTDNATLFVGGQYWVYKSTDGGDSWNALPDGFIDRYLATVGVNPSHPGTVIAGSICSTGISVSHDHGQTFAWRRSGLNPYHEGEFGEHYAMQIAAAGDHIYATTSAGLLISSDNGTSWRLLDNQFSGQGDLSGPNNHLHGLAVRPDAPETVYVGTGRGGGGGGQDTFDGASLWKSSDGGQSWDTITDGFSTDVDTSVKDILVNPHNPDVVYVGTNARSHLNNAHPGTGAGMYRSTTGGAEWMEVGTPFSNVHAITVDAASPGKIYVSSPDGVYRSQNGGSDWTSVLSHRTRALLAHPSEPGLVFAGAQKYPQYWDVLVSRDGGETWREGDLTIQVGSKPDRREYDAAELHSDYWGKRGQIMWFDFDAANSLLYAASHGTGLWQADTTTVE